MQYTHPFSFLDSRHLRPGERREGSNRVLLLGRQCSLSVDALARTDARGFWDVVICLIPASNKLLLLRSRREAIGEKGDGEERRWPVSRGGAQLVASGRAAAFGQVPHPAAGAELGETGHRFYSPRGLPERQSRQMALQCLRPEGRQSLA